MPQDFIPSQDPEFDTFLEELGASVNDPLNPLGVTTSQVLAFNDALIAWTPAWDAWKTISPEIQSKLDAKNTARTGATTIARQINNTVQANPAIPSKAKSAAGLPVHKETRTPVGEIETAPMLQKVDNEHQLQRLWFVDSATPTSRAKPAGAASCEIHQQIVALGAPAPTDPEAMPFVAIDTRAPYRADFAAADIGKTAYYALRWLNTRGEPGPWSTIEGHPVI